MTFMYFPGMDSAVALAAGFGAARFFTTAARTIRDSKDAVGFARRKFLLSGTFESQWLGLDFELIDSDEGYSQVDLDDINQFLASDGAKTLLALCVLNHLAGRTQLDSKFQETLEKSFNSECRRWCAESALQWASNSAHLWARIWKIYEDNLPSADHSPELLADLEYFQDFTAQSLASIPSVSKSAVGQQTFIKSLIDLAKDVEELARLSKLATSLSAAVAGSSFGQIITHTDPERSTHFDDLYVDRDFVDPRTGDRHPSSLLISAFAPFRVLISGSPGAGKSTFVQHFTMAISAQDSGKRDSVVIVVKCREYSTSDWSRISIIDYAASQVSAQLSMILSTSELRSLLLLGRCVMVFDGLDEITEVLRRVEFAKRLTTFSGQYPLTSILVTTRAVGYERAGLDSSNFLHLKLDEFSTNQVTEYVARWFSISKRGDLLEKFMHDSNSIADLRINPLMLSLLCILYRESGSIPSNRLGIYAECAALLFRRWDAHRQISSDGAFPEFADELMQEIARWFFTSPTAQAGLEEQVIRQMLGKILVDRYGLHQTAASDSARGFLDFCAGRAWLLGSVGTNSHGERLFSFTHRTFYEYFTAEAFARNASNADDVCSQILSAFQADATTVLPELLVQAYGKHNANGAATVIKRLNQDVNVSNLLLLRLMEGASLPAHTRKMVFDRVRESWVSSSLSLINFRRILQMNSLSRQQFVTDNLMADEAIALRFLQSWAHLTLAGGTTTHSTTWNPIVSNLIEKYGGDLIGSEEPIMANWNLVRGLAAPLDPVWRTVVFSTDDGVVGGAVWWAIMNHLDIRSKNNAPETLQLRINNLIDLIESRVKIPYATAVNLEILVMKTDFSRADGSGASTDSERLTLRLIEYFALAVSEVSDSRTLFDIVDGSSSYSVEALRAARSEVIDSGLPPRKRTLSQSPFAGSSVMPAVMQQWGKGRYNLVKAPPPVRFDD